MINGYWKLLLFWHLIIPNQNKLLYLPLWKEASFKKSTNKIKRFLVYVYLYLRHGQNYGCNSQCDRFRPSQKHLFLTNKFLISGIVGNAKGPSYLLLHFIPMFFDHHLYLAKFILLPWWRFCMFLLYKYSAHPSDM